jgi:hypothetical protein
MFGDNQAEVNNSAIPHCCLCRRHNVPSYHRVCEAIAAKNANLGWINDKNNPADMLVNIGLIPRSGICCKIFYSGDASVLRKEDETALPF